MKNNFFWFGFLFPEICQILNRFTGVFCRAQKSLICIRE